MQKQCFRQSKVNRNHPALIDRCISEGTTENSFAAINRIGKLHSHSNDTQNEGFCCLLSHRKPQRTAEKEEQRLGPSGRQCEECSLGVLYHRGRVK